MPHYYTVCIPYSARPTVWHPTDSVGPFSVLTRGAFASRVDAEKWATDNLNGQAYTIKSV